MMDLIDLKQDSFVDNFSGFKTQDARFGIQNSIDREYGELRPKHYTTAVDLVHGPVVDTDATNDINFAEIEGNNVRKQANDIISLDYAEVEYLSQTLPTRTESVTPFLISFWNGTIELTPASDNWVDQARLDAKIIQQEGNYTETFEELAANGTIDPQTGFGPVVGILGKLIGELSLRQKQHKQELNIMDPTLFIFRVLVIET